MAKIIEDINIVKHNKSIFENCEICSIPFEDISSETVFTIVTKRVGSDKQTATTEFCESCFNMLKQEMIYGLN